MQSQRNSLPSIRLAPAALLALLLFGALALFCHAYLRILLHNAGVSPELAYNLSYVVVPLIVLAPVPVVLRGQAHTFKQFLDPSRLKPRHVLGAIVLGILLRIIFWTQIVVRGAFGIGTDPSAAVSVAPTFVFDCPPLHILGLGILIMAIVVPITEEILYRGVLQSAFVHRGPVVAIGFSALLFAVFHQPSGYLFVYLIGVVIGIQFLRTQTLWATVTTHGTYNGLAQLDWICLTSRWQPSPQELPMLLVGSAALIAAISACLGIAVVLYRCEPGRVKRPGERD